MNDPAASWRGINLLTSHWRRPVSRGFDLWIPAYARMTIFAAPTVGAFRRAAGNPTPGIQI